MSDRVQLVEADRLPRTFTDPAHYQVRVMGTSFMARGATRAEADAALLARLQANLSSSNTWSGVVMCGDGTVMVCCHSGYSVFRDGQYRGGTILGEGSPQDHVMDAARRHAEQSYGGVTWSNPK